MTKRFDAFVNSNKSKNFQSADKLIWKIVLLTPLFFLYYFRCVKSIPILELTCLWPSKKNKERRKLLIKTLSLEKFQLVRMFFNCSLPPVWFLRRLLLRNKIKTRKPQLLSTSTTASMIYDRFSRRSLTNFMLLSIYF